MNEQCATVHLTVFTAFYFCFNYFDYFYSFYVKHFAIVNDMCYINKLA